MPESTLFLTCSSFKSALIRRTTLCTVLEEEEEPTNQPTKAMI
jgi:hypothetical protein